MARKELKRTCKRDNTVWYVSKDALKERAPNKFERGSIKLGAAGASVSPRGAVRGGGAMQLVEMNNKIERVRKRDSCPACGSQSFSEEWVKIER